MALALAAAAAAQQTPQPAASVQPAPASAQQPAAGPAQQPASATAPTTPLGAVHRPSKHDREEAQKLFVQGAKDVQRNDVRAAMDAFVRAAELDPEERKYEMADQIARQHLVTDLIQQADKDKILGHFADARAKIAEAYSVDPSSPVAAQHMDELASITVAGEPAERSEAVAVAPPIELQPKPGLRSFHIRSS
jgi:tetratricopeptide (TPR) repeat protein